MTDAGDDGIVDLVHTSGMSPPATQTRAEELLQQMYGPEAEFRNGQLEAILATVDRRARTLLVQRTGWGKSLVYFVATKILRDHGLGPTLLISPLLSLMRNQVEAAHRIGSLEDILRRRDTRDKVLSGRMTLFTPSHPSAKFTVAAAMGRNKLIYSLATWAVVVSSALDSGGTWAGAVENLNAGWVPLFVRSDEGAPEGNRALIERGGSPFSLAQVSMPLGDWLQGASARPTPQELPVAQVAREQTFPYDVPDPTPPGEFVADIFSVVWPQLASYLSEPRTIEDVATVFQLERVQVKAWIERAVSEGKVTKHKRPVRFQAVFDLAGHGSLF